MIETDEPLSDLTKLALRTRATEDRLLQLETALTSLDDKHDDLRSEMRSEIKSLREQLDNLAREMQRANDRINDKVDLANTKLDKICGARGILWLIGTLIMSAAGSGLVHFAISVGAP